MSHHPQCSSGPPWPNISNDNSNYNYIYGEGNTTTNNNSVHNYLLAPEVIPDPRVIIEKALAQHHLPSAVFEVQPGNAGCMPGTRVQFLEQVLTLLTARTGPHIAWIAGMAGTGKTSIAHTLCLLLWADTTVFLGGSFFCSRSTGTVERTDVQRIVPTLAMVLARQFPDYAVALSKHLVQQPDIAHWSVRSQVDRLLTLPLSELGRRDGNIVFVIDALDECSDQGKLVELIDALADFKSILPVKFLLTSRPEMYIRRTPISNPNLSSILRLHTIDPTQVTVDLHLYIGETLARGSDSTTWYSQYDIDTLVQQSCGLFIFASTVLKYILDRHSDQGRRDRLRKVTQAVARGTATTASLDRIYELVLTEASRPDKVDSDELEDTIRVLACILTARASLSIQALADLIGIDPASLRGALERLPSIVHVPDDNTDPGIQTLHASFGDYMFDRAASRIRITPVLGHDIFVRGCLGRLGQNDLCFNISRSRSSFEPNPDDMPDWIPLSLLYVCLHRAHHLDAASKAADFGEEVGRIFSKKLLFWLEVLSVVKKIDLASGLLRVAASVVQPPAISLFLREANSFVASSYNAIARSASHIDLSALPFSAKESLIWQYFGSRCTGMVSIETLGIGRHGQSLIMTLTGHKAPPASLAYSQNGRYLASGSGPESYELVFNLCDIAVRVWDTRTGEEAMTPIGVDNGRILAIGFVLDDKAVAVCTSEGLVRVRDISTGRDIRSWQCHESTNEIDCAAFSSDGTLVATSLRWGEVLVWSINTGEQMFALGGPGGTITGIAFSSNGRLATMFSKPPTIWLWDGCTGLPVGDPLIIGNSTEHNMSPSLAISSDGTVLAVGLSINKIEVYDLNTQMRASVSIDSKYFPNSVAFSPNGLHLAVVCNDTIHFWDWRTKKETTTSLRGHTSGINFISYSPDGVHIASASVDRTIRIWDVGSNTPVTQPLPQPSGMTCLALSSNNAIIVSGSHQGSVQVWDTQNGRLKLQTPVGIEGRVTSVAVSPNGLLIASASHHRLSGSESSGSDWPESPVIRLWNAQTGEPVEGVLEGPGGVVREMLFFPDMLQLVSASELTSSATRTCATVHIWNLKTRLPSTLGTFEQNCGGFSQSSHVLMSMSPDGQRIAVAVSQARKLHIWLTGSGRQLGAPLQCQYDVSFVAFSVDGSKIVTGTLSGTFEVRDIHGGQIASVHTGDTPMRGSLGFDIQLHFSSLARSLNERFLAREVSPETGVGHKMRLWDAATLGVVTTVHLNKVGAGAAFSTDSQSLMIGGRDRIMVWSLEAVLALADRPTCDPLAQLLRYGPPKDGWVKGPSGELLLWIPAEYHEYLQLSPCTLMVSKIRVALSGDAADLRYGTDWTSCWR